VIYSTLIKKERNISNKQLNWLEIEIKYTRNIQENDIEFDIRQRKEKKRKEE